MQVPAWVHAARKVCRQCPVHACSGAHDIRATILHAQLCWLKQCCISSPTSPPSPTTTPIDTSCCAHLDWLEPHSPSSTSNPTFSSHLNPHKHKKAHLLTSSIYTAHRAHLHRLKPHIWLLRLPPLIIPPGRRDDVRPQQLCQLLCVHFHMRRPSCTTKGEEYRQGTGSVGVGVTCTRSGCPLLQPQCPTRCQFNATLHDA